MGLEEVRPHIVAHLEKLAVCRVVECEGLFSLEHPEPRVGLPYVDVHLGLCARGPEKEPRAKLLKGQCPSTFLLKRQYITTLQNVCQRNGGCRSSGSRPKASVEWNRGGGVKSSTSSGMSSEKYQVRRYGTGLSFPSCTEAEGCVAGSSCMQEHGGGRCALDKAHARTVCERVRAATQV